MTASGWRIPRHSTAWRVDEWLQLRQRLRFAVRCQTFLDGDLIAASGLEGPPVR
jgi:hypothetical protein